MLDALMYTFRVSAEDYVILPDTYLPKYMAQDKQLLRVLSVTSLFNLQPIDEPVAKGKGGLCQAILVGQIISRRRYCRTSENRRTTCGRSLASRRVTLDTAGIMF